jgi:hypothetical protein
VQRRLREPHPAVDGTGLLCVVEQPADPVLQRSYRVTAADLDAVAVEDVGDRVSCWLLARSFRSGRTCSIAPGRRRTHT